ncbi:MAG: DUF465 domain-containing protein [Sphingomonadaceae bacterium]|nr:DUF465 domain-containing protein [Sphingomonadaceae bacterium]
MIGSHRETLSARHAALERRIAAEAQRPNPDTILLRELKREKLRLKDALAGLTRH